MSPALNCWDRWLTCSARDCLMFSISSRLRRSSSTCCRMAPWCDVNSPRLNSCRLTPTRQPAQQQSRRWRTTRKGGGEEEEEEKDEQEQQGQGKGEGGGRGVEEEEKEKEKEEEKEEKGKSMYGSFHQQTNAWCAGKTVRSVENACHTWALRGVFTMRRYTNPQLLSSRW